MKAWIVIDGATLTDKPQSTRSNPYLKKRPRQLTIKLDLSKRNRGLDSVGDENASSVLQLHNIRRAKSRICKILVQEKPLRYVAILDGSSPLVAQLT